jgi:hypothetical protein
MLIFVSHFCLSAQTTVEKAYAVTKTALYMTVNGFQTSVTAKENLLPSKMDPFTKVPGNLESVMVCLKPKSPSLQGRNDVGTLLF